MAADVQVSVFGEPLRVFEEQGEQPCSTALLYVGPLRNRGDAEELVEPAALLAPRFFAAALKGDVPPDLEPSGSRGVSDLKMHATRLASIRTTRSWLTTVFRNTLQSVCPGAR